MRAVVYRTSNRVARFVDEHAFVLLILSVVAAGVSVFLNIQKILPSSLTSVPQYATVVAALPGVASGVKYLHDWLEKRRQQQVAIQTSDDAQRQTRALVLAAVVAAVGNRASTLLDSRLQLSLTTKPSDVDDPQTLLPGRGVQVGAALPAGTPIKKIYDDAQGQLLILGAGGAGKTGIVLDLADALVQACGSDPSGPVPVLLPLASWRPTTLSLKDWLVGQMAFFYRINPLLGDAWITGRKVIPLLDGLDAAGAEAGRACIDAINQFLDTTNIPIVVSSRTVEYEALGKRLRFHGAVEVQPLSQDEITECLKSPGLEGLAQAVAADDALRQLTATPWFLGVAVTAYRHKVAGSVPTGGATDELREHILNDYVQTCLSDPNTLAPDPRYTPDATRAWLRWLARKMVDRKQEVFFYDLMQPDLLASRREARLATFGVAGAAGVVAGLLALASYAPIFGGLLSAFLSVVAGIVVGMAAYEPRITPTSKLRWSWQQLRSGLAPWLFFGPVFGLLAGLSVGAIVQLQGATVVWLGFVLSGVVAGLCLGLFFALVGALRNELPTEPPNPGDGITTSLTTGVKGGAIMLAASAVISGVGGAAIVTLSTLPLSANGNLTRWLVTGLVVEALAVGLVLGLAGVDPGVRRGLQRTWRTSVVITLGVAIVNAQVAAFMAGQFGVAARFIVSGSGATASRAIVAAVLLAMLVGVGTGICHGTLRGGGTYLRHKALLDLLKREGMIAPNYLLFLRHMSNVRIVQRRGGGYEFLHRYLLEHFADGGSDAPPQAPGTAPNPVAVDA